jgi:hypothetical protein
MLALANSPHLLEWFTRETKRILNAQGWVLSYHIVIFHSRVSSFLLLPLSNSAQSDENLHHVPPHQVS